MVANSIGVALACRDFRPFGIRYPIEDIVAMQDLELGIDLGLAYIANKVGGSCPLRSNNNISSRIHYKKLHFGQISFGRQQCDQHRSPKDRRRDPEEQSPLPKKRLYDYSN